MDLGAAPLKTIDQLQTMFLDRRTRFADRDMRNRNLQFAMLGFWHLAYPDHFRDIADRPMVHNALNTAAYDFAEMLAALPTLSVPPEADSDAAQKRADKRAKIVSQGYWWDWRWELKMLQTALWYVTYGYVPVCIWPSATSRAYGKRAPYADPQDPMRYLPGPVAGYGEQPVDGFVYWEKPVSDLAEIFPEAARKLSKYNPDIRRYEAMSDSDTIVLARYHGPGEITLLLPEHGEILTRVPLPDDLKHPTLVQAVRPGIDPAATQSPFEQLIGVFVGQAREAGLLLRFLERQVHAPLAVDEETEYVQGPDAIIRVPRGGQLPSKVQLALPPDVWRGQEFSERQLRLGSRRPASRDGESPVSYATGKGIDALASGLDSQLKAAQTIFGWFLQDLNGAALCLDQALYPDEEKPIGELRETYVPSRDIAGRYTVEANYGLLMGINPSYATVMLSQLIAGGLLSHKTAMTQLPVIASLSKEYERLREERGEETLMAYLQQAALQGDASAMEAVSELAPDSPVVKIIQKMQASQQEQQQAAAGAQIPPGGVPVPGQGGGEVQPNPMQQAEAGANALQAGSGGVRDLATLLGPLAQKLGNQGVAA